ncbi:MAG: bifunctional hydroxymethylpyrimidine kinase/phosphomethylpyrimidine kinase [Pyrinomonadaceae bacterium]
MTKICLTIAGLDPSGGAGIIADIKTFEAFGCFATAAISSITFQNTTGVFGAAHQTAESIRGQVEPILQDYNIAAIKTGMLPTREVIREVAELIRKNNLKNIVVDPVVRSTSGFDLIDNDALQCLIENLFPLADLITPNIPEVERIYGVAIESERDIADAAEIMHSQGARNVLIKGGHLSNADSALQKPAREQGRYAHLRTKRAGPERECNMQKPARSKGETTGTQASLPAHHTATDYLFLSGDLHKIDGPFYETTATHGTGCVLSAAIAANLALGKSLLEAVRIAKAFVNQAIRTAPMIGHGHSPINVKPI